MKTNLTRTTTSILAKKLATKIGGKMSGTKTCENVILNDNFQKSWRERQFQNLPKIDPEQQFAEKLLGSKICTMYNLHPWDKLKDTDN